MRKPVAVLNTLTSFVDLLTGYCSGQLDVNLNVSDSELFELLETTKSKVSDSLADDFDTNTAIIELLNLVAFINRLFTTRDKANPANQRLYKNYGPLMAIVQYLRFSLNSFGIVLSDSKQDKKVFKEIFILNLGF
jgi:hypothetical protein